MSFYAYLLRCADGSFYVGHTESLEQRVAQHQRGELPGYTHARRPVELIWSQDFPTRLEALGAERQIKGWTRVKKQALAAGDWEALRQHARKSFDTGLRQAQPLLRTNGGGEATGAISPPPPVIVLVRPQLGENIGKAARAMLNFGLTEMRLVTPRDGWPNPSAGPAASGADIVLERAQVFDSVAAAVADCETVYATTVRKRGVTKPVVTPEEAATAIHAAPGRSAVLFGPERSGLETDDVAIARAILTVPINAQFGSLNLAQAVILVAYEWSKGGDLVQPSITEILPPAPQEELDGMIGQLDAMLVGSDYFFPAAKGVALRRTLRTLLTKPGWSSQEIRTLRGVLSSLAGKKPRT